jgi:hypothetical protein
MGCIAWLLILAGVIFLMITLIQWFEQTAEAVDYGAWDRVVLLMVMPFAVWLYRSQVGAGRPTAVPLHEPVRGFGVMPKSRAATPSPGTPGEGRGEGSSSGPPPGTPKEFLEKPKIPPGPALAKRAKSSSVDPEKLARLKQKMREQGMLPPDSDDQGKPDA